MMWPDATETRCCWKRVATKDAMAAERLWETYRAPLRRMIELRLDRALGRRVDASDVVQDVLIRASQRLDEYLRSLGDAVLPCGSARSRADAMIDEHPAAPRRRAAQPGPRTTAGGGRVLDRFVARPGLRSSATTSSHPRPRPSAVSSSGGSRRRSCSSTTATARSSCSATSSSSRTAKWRHTLGLSEAAAGMRHLRALRRLPYPARRVPLGRWALIYE